MANEHDDEDFEDDEDDELVLESEETPFESREILDAIRCLDGACRILGAPAHGAIRNELLELHALTSRVLVERDVALARTVRDRTFALSEQVTEAADALEEIFETLRRVIGCLQDTTDVERPS
jgi:hypothetical protein